MNKVYLENGNAIQTNWEDSIALSYIPTVGRALPYAITIEKYNSAGGDFVNETLSITPIVMANKFWVIKDMAGTIQTDHYFNDIEFHQEGEYRFIYSKSNTGVVSLTIFSGKDTTDVIFKTSLTNNVSYYGIKYTLNTGISNNTNFEGIIEYRRNVVCIGSEVVLVLGATERARVFAGAATPLYTNSNNQVRFYIKEKGCYKLLDDTSAATKEVTKASLAADTLIRKDNIVSVAKTELDMSVVITFADIQPIKVRAGEVANKATYTKDVTGLILMYNAIQSWL